MEVFTRSDVPCFYLEPATLRIITANAAAANDLGKPRTKLSQETLYSLFPDVDLAQANVEAAHSSARVDLSTQQPAVWQQATLSPIVAGGTGYLKFVISRDPAAPPAATEFGTHDHTAESFLNHALSILLNDGYSNFSMRKVAKQAQAGLGHLQHYYRPKFRLIQAMLDSLTANLLQCYDYRMAPLPSATDRLTALLRFAVDDHQSGHMLALIREFRLMAKDIHGLKLMLNTMHRQTQRLFQNLFMEINPDLSLRSANTLANDTLALLADADAIPTGAAPGYQEHLIKRILQLPLDRPHPRRSRRCATHRATTGVCPTQRGQ